MYSRFVAVERRAEIPQHAPEIFSTATPPTNFDLLEIYVKHHTAQSAAAASFVVAEDVGLYSRDRQYVGQRFHIMRRVVFQIRKYIR
jgi:hypothetical protein